MSLTTAEVQSHWIALKPLLTIQTEADYDRTIDTLNQLLDEVGTDEQHPLYGLVDTIGTLLHNYEEQHHTIPDCTGAEALQFLLEEHGLSHVDLTELGNPATVEAILAGESDLTLPQIRLLSQRFRVSPSVFV